MSVPGVYTGLAVLTMIPAAPQPRNTAVYSGQLPENSKTTSPFLYPSLVSPLATLIASSFNSSPV